MIQIAEYTNKLNTEYLNSEYKLYVRHHMPLPYCVETILYAIIQ